MLLYYYFTDVIPERVDPGARGAVLWGPLWACVHAHTPLYNNRLKCVRLKDTIIFSHINKGSEKLPGVGVLRGLGDCVAESHDCYRGVFLFPPLSPMIGLDHRAPVIFRRTSFWKVWMIAYRILLWYPIIGYHFVTSFISQTIRGTI